MEKNREGFITEPARAEKKLYTDDELTAILNAFPRTKNEITKKIIMKLGSLTDKNALTFIHRMSYKGYLKQKDPEKPSKEKFYQIIKWPDENSPGH